MPFVGRLWGEMGASQTGLPFKLAATDEASAAQGGWALVGEFLVGGFLRAFGLGEQIDREVPAFGSVAGCRPSAHVLPRVSMLSGGGRTRQILRVLRRDEGLRRLLQLPVLQLQEMPSRDATGDGLRRMGSQEMDSQASDGLAGLARVNRRVFRRLLRRAARIGDTLAIDATQIVVEKREAHSTYKGEKGYMPIAGHIAERGVVAGYACRAGNAAPAARNLAFLQACEDAMPGGKKSAVVRTVIGGMSAALAAIMNRKIGGKSPFNQTPACDPISHRGFWATCLS